MQKFEDRTEKSGQKLTASSYRAFCCAVVSTGVCFFGTTTIAIADVEISTGVTENMACSGGVCAPTASNAVFNVTDLENALSSGNLTVMTTGTGGVQANDIEIDADLSWAATNALTLDAFHSVRVAKPVSITGGGGLTILTNDGGSGGFFGFAAGANVEFSSLASNLTINGSTYTLVNSVISLASAIASNPGGSYAIANNYDAAGDGTYANSPIPTKFSGNFEGLGNSISHLSLDGTGNIDANVGLFANLSQNNGPGGEIENIALRNLRVKGKGFIVGGLVGNNVGTISGVFVSGTVGSERRQTAPGLLAAENGGTITRSGASGSITTTNKFGGGGGLVANNTGLISLSYADCTITSMSSAVVGGLVGGNNGAISQSYAIGSGESGFDSAKGGLVGENHGTISQSYSTTALMHVRRNNPDTGGLIGIDYSTRGSDASDYWDTSTSRIRDRSRGAGTPKNDPGITGLTTGQLQSGLPKGFDPTVWAEDSKINGGLPYLIDNPPQK